MKSIITLFFLFSAMIFGNQVHAQITGTWQGMLQVQGTEIPLVFHITKDGEIYMGTMDSPNQGAMGIKLDSVNFEHDSLSVFYKASGGIKYKGELKDTLINGTYSQGNFSFPLQLKKISDSSKVALIRPQEPKPPFPYTIEDVSFKNSESNLKIAGTLTLPPNSKNPPIAVMITGSGQEDRNEELFGHKPFWVIADYFARNGIGVLRDDDRGIGGSESGDLTHVTSADFATDVHAAIDFLQTKGYTNVGLIGHSEGGMIAPMVASQRNDVKFIIMLAGPGVSGDSILTEQAYLGAKAEGVSENIAASNASFLRKTIEFIKNYNSDSLYAAVGNYMDTAVLRQPMFGSLSQSQRESIKVQQAKTLTNPWTLYFIKYNPAPALEKTQCPVLALNGTLDMQVPCKENLNAIEKALKKGGNQHYKIMPMEGLNHLFQHAKTGGGSEYGKIAETISPQVLEIMKDWILQNYK
ncbi:alpha/beta hydrolase family protein [Parafilimonas sp.]|uniref:alpha/beta hydrolase family protein n=1 Tax=Parafilimonas sp. TaxID=1969739 RepID=UPI0039E39DD3